MQIITEKEKIFIIAKDESEAMRTELLISRLVNQQEMKQTSGYENWELFLESTRSFKQVPQSDIDELAAQVDESLWLNFKRGNQNDIGN